MATLETFHISALDGGTSYGISARHWATYNGTTAPASILNSYNISSISRPSSSVFTASFTNSASTANIQISGIANCNRTGMEFQSSTTTSATWNCNSGGDNTAACNPAVGTVVVFY